MNEYDIAAAFQAIEEELIASMIRNMDRHRAEETKEGYEWSMWQAEQLKALEKYKQENQKKYTKRFKELNGEIEDLIRQARQAGSMGQEIQILEAIKKGFTARKSEKGMMAEFFKLNERKLEALIQAVLDDMEKAETAVLRKSNDDYRKAIYNAQVYANTGAGTYEKAVDMATRDMLSVALTVSYIPTVPDTHWLIMRIWRSGLPANGHISRARGKSGRNGGSRPLSWLSVEIPVLSALHFAGRS